jgi:hypothetical protein
MYAVKYDHRRDRSSMKNIARQCWPGQVDFIYQAYIRAVECRDHGYLFLDCHPKNKSKYWLRSDIFASPDAEVYLPD